MQSASVPPPKTVSFEHLYDEWFGQVSRWVRALGARQSDLEDVVQDVFTVAYRRMHLFDGNNIAGWLYQIARRKARDYRRLTWVQHIFFSDMSTPLRAAPHIGPGPLDELETKQKSELLCRRLAKLPAAQRAVFMLFELEGFSGHEIAQQQQVPLNTVWVRLFTARRKLNCRSRAPEKRSQTRRPKRFEQ
jgi:RNA polymerase sigma factor (sigma-70 family)